MFEIQLSYVKWLEIRSSCLAMTKVDFHVCDNVIQDVFNLFKSFHVQYKIKVWFENA